MPSSSARRAAKLMSLLKERALKCTTQGLVLHLKIASLFSIAFTVQQQREPCQVLVWVLPL